MKSRRVLILLLFVFAPVFTLAAIPSEPQSMGEAFGVFAEIQKAIQAQDYVYLAVLGLMLATFVIKRYMLARDSSQDGSLPSITALLGAFLGGAGAATAGGDISSGILGGVLAGNAATGAYDAFIKPLKKKKKK